MMEKKEKKMLTIRQRMLIKYHLEGHTIKDAAVKAGYSEASAYTHGSRVLKNLYECGALDEKLAALGLSDEYLAMKIMEGLEAKNANGVPDYGMRHKYLETALKLRGELVEKTSVEHECGDTLFDIIAKANEEEEGRQSRFDIGN